MKAVTITVIVFYLLIGTISVVGNFLVLIVVYKSKELRHSQYVYNFSIAISDIIYGSSICLFFVNSCLNLFYLNPIDIKEVYDDEKRPNIKYSNCGRTS